MKTFNHKTHERHERERSTAVLSRSGLERASRCQAVRTRPVSTVLLRLGQPRSGELSGCTRFRVISCGSWFQTPPSR